MQKCPSRTVKPGSNPGSVSERSASTNQSSRSMSSLNFLHAHREVYSRDALRLPAKGSICRAPRWVVRKANPGVGGGLPYCEELVLAIRRVDLNLFRVFEAIMRHRSVAG